MSVTRVKRKNSHGKLEYETTVSKTQGIFKPNNFSLNILQEVKPLLDNSNTPRGAKKAITLERNFDHDVWIYNKNHMDEFTKTAKDVKKGKLFKKKILRK